MNENTLSWLYPSGINPNYFGIYKNKTTVQVHEAISIKVTSNCCLLIIKKTFLIYYSRNQIYYTTVEYQYRKETKIKWLQIYRNAIKIISLLVGITNNET